MGAANRQLSDPKRLCDVSKAEVILKFYLGESQAPEWVHGYATRLQPHYGQLSPSEYRSAQVAVAKAFRRLEQRGLAERVWRSGGTGINLTQEGLREVLG